MTLKKQFLISVTSSVNILLGLSKPLPLPYWLILNSFPNIDENSVINILYKLESEGAVIKSYFGKSKYIMLAAKGRERLLEDVKQVRFLREIWDGKFRMVLFDIPESDRKLRAELRLVLEEMGFRMWQRSVFITPHHIDEEFTQRVKKLSLNTQNKQVHLLIIQKVSEVDEKDLAWKLWALGGLNERYKEFITRSESLLVKRISDRKHWVLDCQELRFNYFNLLCEEPFMPRGLLGDEYLFEEASRCFDRLGNKMIDVLERA